MRRATENQSQMKSVWGCVKSTDPPGSEQDYSPESREKEDESWKIWFEALRLTK